jgi:AhpD family alkylhydroperoxidase
MIMAMNKLSVLKKTGRKPRLDPLEHPHGIMLKLAYYYSRKRIGKVITPMKVVSARFPETLKLSRDLIKVYEKVDLDKELALLIKTYVATLNGCAFCVDIDRADAIDHEINTSKYDELLRFEESGAFSEAEKAALSFAEEVTLTKQVSDATFNCLRTYFSEREIVEITWLIASEHFYNLMNRPLNIGSDELCKLLRK